MCEFAEGHLVGTDGSGPFSCFRMKRTEAIANQSLTQRGMLVVWRLEVPHTSSVEVFPQGTLLEPPKDIIKHFSLIKISKLCHTDGPWYTQR